MLYEVIMQGTGKNGLGRSYHVYTKGFVVAESVDDASRIAINKVGNDNSNEVRSAFNKRETFKPTPIHHIDWECKVTEVPQQIVIDEISFPRGL